MEPKKCFNISRELHQSLRIFLFPQNTKLAQSRLGKKNNNNLLGGLQKLLTAAAMAGA